MAIGMDSEDYAKKLVEKGWEWGDSQAHCVEQWAQGSQAVPRPLMVSLMAWEQLLNMVDNGDKHWSTKHGSCRQSTHLSVIYRVFGTGINGGCGI